MSDYIDREAARAFARCLYRSHPGLRSKHSLYLDFEGSRGYERILSVYWPFRHQFDVLWRGYSNASLTRRALEKMLDKLGCDEETVRWVVVFSSGESIAEEQLRFEATFGDDWFPRAKWVNLHYFVRHSPLRAAIRRTGWARRTQDKKQVLCSLENLEHQFCFVRPPRLRSHSNRYSAGKTGEMGVLEEEQEVFNSGGDIFSNTDLIDYCQWDVESMYEIVKYCEFDLMD